MVEDSIEITKEKAGKTTDNLRDDNETILQKSGAGKKPAFSNVTSWDCWELLVANTAELVASNRAISTILFSPELFSFLLPRISFLKRSQKYL